MVHDRADKIPDDILYKMLDLNFSIQIGFETFLQERAIRMGKASQEQDVRYVDKAKGLLKKIAVYAQAKGRHVGDVVGYLIDAAVGDSIIDVARDLNAQLEIMLELWGEYQFVPMFLHATHQSPLLGDRVTYGEMGEPTGQPDIQPQFNPKSINHYIAGDVFGMWHPFELVEQGGTLCAGCIFEPIFFKFDPNVTSYALWMQQFGEVTQRQYYEAAFRFLAEQVDTNSIAPEERPAFGQEVDRMLYLLNELREVGILDQISISGDKTIYIMP
jgi:hypothetical protein